MENRYMLGFRHGIPIALGYFSVSMAFGILAVVCLFGPAVLRVVLWMGVCLLGQVACDLLEEGGLGSLFGSCASVAKMILAVLVSVLTVAIVCAALLLFVKGTL